LARAAAVYAEHGAECVILSGGTTWGGQREADVMRREIVRLGVPAELLKLESRSRNTHENARFSSQELLALNFEGVAQVTCDFHMARAQTAFRRYGWQPVAYPAITPPVSCWRTQLRNAREYTSALSMRLHWDGITAR